MKSEAAKALKHANRAARKAKAAEAERWSRTAARLASAADGLDAPAPSAQQTDEERRAELRRRLELYVAADVDIQAWEHERDVYEAALQAALANGADLPPPLRPHPAGGLSDKDFLERIALGPLPPA